MVNSILGLIEYGLVVVDRVTCKKLKERGLEPVEVKEDDGTTFELFMLDEIEVLKKPAIKTRQFVEEMYEG